MKPEKSFNHLPGFSSWLIRKIFNDESEIMIGDFAEVYHNYAQKKNRAKAWWWFNLYLIKSIPPYLKDSIASWLAILKNNFICSIRNLGQNKLTTLVNIIGLAVGMACFLLISFWINDEKGYDQFHEKKDNLYLLTITHPNGAVDYNAPYALAPLMADKFPEIIHFTRIYEYSERITTFFKFQPKEGSPVMFNEGNVNLVDRHFFSMFSFPFKYGNPQTALEKQNSLVITDKMAQKYFGKKNPLGKVLTLNNSRELNVTGVIRIPTNSELQLDFIIPLRSRLDQDWNWSDRSFILLEANTALPQFKKKIAGFMNKINPYRQNQKFQVGIFPMTRVHLGFGRQVYVTIFSLIALLILLIACINYTNLATAHAATRSREVGLKKVVGASHSQLIQQFLRESLLVSVFSFFIALLLVQLFLPLINNLTSKKLSFALLQNYSWLLFYLFLIIAVGIIAGIYPAIFLSKKKPIESLKPAFNSKAGRSIFRQISVVGQFSISILLIICSALVIQQLHYIRNRPLGISTDHVIKIPINPMLVRSFTPYKSDLKQNSNILNVTAGQTVPFNEDFKTIGVEWDGRPPGTVVNFRYTISHLDYLETFGMKIAAGRSFRNDFSDYNNYLINEKAAEYMNMKNPLGQRLKFWKQEGTIIGVVQDYHHVPLHKEIMPHIFVINPRSYGALKHIFIKISSHNISATIDYIRKKTLALAPGYPFSYTFLDKGIAALYQSEKKLGQILGYFALLAIVISCLGIFALASFSTQRKTKEIGIRKVIGSSAMGIIILLSKTFFRWVLLANLIAWPIGYLAMQAWLKNFAYRTNPNLLVFIAAATLSLMIAAIPIFSQTAKAARANPIESLRYE